jgi:hypothetical protein
MDARTRANWHKVREGLEAAGKTDCYLYRRALAITTGSPDPGPYAGLAPTPA